MNKGKINIVVSKTAPDKNVLWCKLNEDGGSFELKYFGSNGWETLGVDATSITADIASAVASSISNATYDASAKTITFTNSSGEVLSEIDASDFIIDGMVESAEYTTTDGDGNSGVYIHITFNTDAGKDDVYVDLNDIITYTDEAIESLSLNDYADYLTVFDNTEQRYVETDGSDATTETISGMVVQLPFSVTLYKGETEISKLNFFDVFDRWSTETFFQSAFDYLPLKSASWSSDILTFTDYAGSSKTINFSDYTNYLLSQVNEDIGSLELVQSGSAYMYTLEYYDSLDGATYDVRYEETDANHDTESNPIIYTMPSTFTLKNSDGTISTLDLSNALTENFQVLLDYLPIKHSSWSNDTLTLTDYLDLNKKIEFSEYTDYILTQAISEETIDSICT